MRLRRLGLTDQLPSDAPRSLASPSAMQGAGGEPNAQDASAILTRGPTEVDRIEAAFAEARRAGREAGAKDIEVDVARRVEIIQARLESDHQARLRTLDAERQRLITSARTIDQRLTAIATDADALAIELAYLAVTRLLAADEGSASAIRALCVELAELHGRPNAVLRVSETDAAALVDTVLDLRIDIDRSLAPGEVVLDSERGQFDTSLEQRLDAIKAGFLAGLERHRAVP